MEGNDQCNLILKIIPSPPVCIDLVLSCEIPYHPNIPVHHNSTFITGHCHFYILLPFGGKSKIKRISKTRGTKVREWCCYYPSHQATDAINLKYQCCMMIVIRPTHTCVYPHILKHTYKQTSEWPGITKFFKDVPTFFPKHKRRKSETQTQNECAHYSLFCIALDNPLWNPNYRWTIALLSNFKRANIAKLNDG